MRWPIFQASQILQSSGVIAYPTETVWGIGCDPRQPSALRRVINLKKRDAQKGLILIAGDIKQFDFLLHDLPIEQKVKLENSWPGAVTWLVPHHNRVHPLVHGQFSTVAIRVSNHRIVKELCAQFNGPIVSTSANLAGQSTIQNAIQAMKFLGHDLDFILQGPLGDTSAPSRIIDLQTGHIIRN